MEKFIAVVFDDDESAAKGESALRDLHMAGELAVYSSAVIGKSADGEVGIRKFEDEGPLGTAMGALLGAMVGVLAGPAAVAAGAAAAGSAAAASAAMTGMAAGSVTGSMFGASRDLWVAGIDAEMLENVSIELRPGKSCLVASVDEIWTAPLDVSMSELGGTVFRKSRIDAIDERYQAEVIEMNRELSELNEGLEHAHAETKAELTENVHEVRAKVTGFKEKISKRMDELKSQTDARLTAIDEQINTAAGKAKEKFEKRRGEVRADYEERKATLDTSMKLANEALRETGF